MNYFVRIIIKDVRKRLLVVKHSGDQSRLWNFPGGKVEPGEEIKEAALREAFEEIGVRILTLRNVGKRSVELGNERWEGYFYFADEIEGLPFLKERNKISELCFKSYQELFALPSIKSLLGTVGNARIVRRLPPSSLMWRRTAGDNVYGHVDGLLSETP